MHKQVKYALALAAHDNFFAEVSACSFFIWSHKGIRMFGGSPQQQFQQSNAGAPQSPFGQASMPSIFGQMMKPSAGSPAFGQGAFGQPSPPKAQAATGFSFGSGMSKPFGVVAGKGAKKVAPRPAKKASRKKKKKKQAKVSLPLTTSIYKVPVVPGSPIHNINYEPRS